ncbi:S24 family peptidase [Escherichia coli]|uniref:S24 family peptidase n=1 Tax=Escherichia coli TaxID=562 RepID=UPI001EDB442C|nr:peptidase S24 [Escherichia coli]UYF61395.1 peptidase S24 [Escherichia coli]
MQNSLFLTSQLKHHKCFSALTILMILETELRVAGRKVIQCSRLSNPARLLLLSLIVVAAFLHPASISMFFTGDIFGRNHLFIKRIKPLPDGSLKNISDNLHYQTFALNTGEQKDIRIHGRVVASLAVRRFV